MPLGVAKGLPDAAAHVALLRIVMRDTMPFHPDPQLLEAGTLPASWLTVPLDGRRRQFHLHPYNDDLLILRQSGYTHFEKPFLYLIFGEERALLIDTGAPGVDVEGAVTGILERRADETGRPVLPLTVTHTHGHSDHVAGDRQFDSRPNTVLIPATVEAASGAFGIEEWPEETGHLDLGGREIDVVPIPGHDAASVAFYDRRTGILLSGDLLYPGRLYVRDANAFRASVRRLVAFTASRPVAHILGAHIENKSAAYQDYAEGTLSQPEEHDLGLGRAHLLELHAVLDALDGDDLPRLALRDFTIWPVPPASVA